MRSVILLSCLVIACGTGESVPTYRSANNDVHATPYSNLTLNNDAGYVQDANISDDAYNPNDAPDTVKECTTATCANSYGYWRKHATWPCDELNVAYLYDGTYYSISESEALTIMYMQSNGDATLILLDQLIASILNGGETIATINVYIDQARSWLSQYGMDTSAIPPFFPVDVDANSTVGQGAVVLAQTLKDFNMGKLNIASCEDDCSGR